MIKKIKQAIYKSLIPLIQTGKYLNWLYYLQTSEKIKLIIGAGTTKYPGWFATDISTLDVTNEKHFKKYFRKKKIDNILAEHVLEHLTETELKLMAQNFYKYSNDKVVIRIAVPDGFHIDNCYIEQIKPGGAGVGADEHKHLFNYKSLSSYFENAGFDSYPVEFWDERGNFHQGYTNNENGYIDRSFINDARNKDGKPNYTSLIIDFKK